MFYVTTMAWVVKLAMNITFGFLFLNVIIRDPGYDDHKDDYRYTARIIAALGTFFSFKLYKLYYCRWFGSTRFYITFEEPMKVHTVFNIMTISNILFTCLPVIGVDLYGLYFYHWGS